MKYDLILMFNAQSNQAATSVYNEAVSLSKQAQASGFNTIWLTEHHGKANRLCPSIPLMMAFLAQYTSLNIGAATILLSHYSPRQIAEEIGMLSNMYKNRFYFGFGKGGGNEVMLHENGDGNLARASMQQNLELLLSYLNPDKNINIYPKPLKQQQLFIASKDEDILKYAAQNCIGIMLGHKWTLQECETIIDFYKCHSSSNKKTNIMMARYFMIGDDNSIDYVKNEITKRKELKEDKNKKETNPWRDGVLEAESPIGSLKYVNEKLKLYKKLGVTNLALRPATFNLKETFYSICEIQKLINV